LLAFAGGAIAVLDHAHVWMRHLAIAAVIGAWLWIAWQRRRSGRPIARQTIAWLIAASLLTTATAAWPLFQPTVFKTMGIVKKKEVSPNG
jgi:glucose dehydrogenase